jgi:hypothetical protein
MKTRASLFLAVITAVAVSQTVAASDTKPAHTHPVNAVERSSSETIVRGSPLIGVYQALGAPAEKLGEENWIYRGFHAGVAQSRHDDCDTLVVSFVNGQVSDLQLVNDRTVVVLAQRIEAKKNTGLFAVASK